MVTFVWWATAGALDRKAVGEIKDDAAKLLTAYDEKGLVALEYEIESRVRQNLVPDGIYLLTDPRLKGIVGNFGGWPTDIDPDTEAESIRTHVTMREGLVPAQFGHWVLPGGSHLLVGRDIHVLSKLRDMLVDAVPWTLLIMVVLGLIGAVVVRRLFISMLADVSQTAAAITAGDLSSRVPLSGRGDEFDDLADTINEMLDRISRLMDGVREVSNAIAHDLRTPITRARARLEDAARACTTEPELRAAVDRAIVDLDGIVSVFHALLRISEIESGARRSAFAAFDLRPVLDDVVELYEPVAEASNQSLLLSAPARLPVFGDRDMLQQAAANLIDNALKFSPPGGVIRLDADAHGFAVSDQGPGIPPGDLDRVTERFFRGETARSAPGSGLGLALVQAVVGLHGGTLRLQDNGPGLRATVSLPPSARPIPQPAARGTPGTAIAQAG